MRIAIILLILAGLGGCARSTADIPAVSNFDTEAYMGTWYEIARLDNTFERGLSAVMAEYQLERGRLRLANRGWHAEDGRWSRSTGRGYQPSPERAEGRFRVTFFWPFHGSYRIIALDDAYQWALVTGGDRSWLWILARSPDLDPAVRDQLLEQARALDFPVDELIWVEHDVPAAPPPPALLTPVQITAPADDS